jgi:antitoxin component YwqK of YwqJK toxin-antitoxin module
MKKNTLFLLPLLILFAWSCTNKNQEEVTLSREEQKIKDSLSLISQKAKVDSLKKLNPLLILPPDSNYSGDYIDKYANGIVKFRGTFRFGERHGQWFSFYPNGTMWSELHFDKGLRHGPNNTFFENGKPRYTGFYKDDLVDSTWTYYDSTGIKVEVLNYKNNKLLNRKRFN